MKTLIKFGAVITALLFLLCLVGFQLHELGNYSKVQPDNQVLESAIIGASILSIIQLLIYLYLLYIGIIVAVKLYQVYFIQSEKDKALESSLNALLDKFKKDMDRPKEAVDSVQFPIKPDVDITKADLFAKKLVKPLRLNYERKEEYNQAVLDYCKATSEGHYKTAVECVTSNVTITTERELDNVVAVMSSNIKVDSVIVAEVLKDFFMIE